MSAKHVTGYEFDYYPKLEPGGIEASEGKPHKVSLWQTFEDGTRQDLRVGEGADDLSALGNLIARMIRHGDAPEAIRSAFDTFLGQYRVKFGHYPPGMAPEHD